MHQYLHSKTVQFQLVPRNLQEKLLLVEFAPIIQCFCVQKKLGESFRTFGLRKSEDASLISKKSLQIKKCYQDLKANRQILQQQV